MKDLFKKIILKVGYKIIFIQWFLMRPTLLGVQLAVKCRGKILLVQHTYMHKGLWDFPGGRIERNELPIDAAKREIKEELGIDLLNIDRIGEFELFNSYHLAHVHAFGCEIESENIKMDKGEIKTIKWFGLNEIPLNLSPMARKIVSLI